MMHPHLWIFCEFGVFLHNFMIRIVKVPTVSRSLFCLWWPRTKRYKPIKIQANWNMCGPQVGIFSRLLGIVWDFPKKEGPCHSVLDEWMNELWVLSLLRLILSTGLGPKKLIHWFIDWFIHACSPSVHPFSGHEILLHVLTNEGIECWWALMLPLWHYLGTICSSCSAPCRWSLGSMPCHQRK
jgi:hypothetical protein